jgi:hypothetical protein
VSWPGFERIALRIKVWLVAATPAYSVMYCTDKPRALLFEHVSARNVMESRQRNVVLCSVGSGWAGAIVESRTCLIMSPRLHRQEGKGIRSSDGLTHRSDLLECTSAELSVGADSSLFIRTLNRVWASYYKSSGFRF